MPDLSISPSLTKRSDFSSVLKGKLYKRGGGVKTRVLRKRRRINQCETDCPPVIHLEVPQLSFDSMEGFHIHNNTFLNWSYFKACYCFSKRLIKRWLLRLFKTLSVCVCLCVWWWEGGGGSVEAFSFEIFSVVISNQSIFHRLISLVASSCYSAVSSDAAS